MSLVSPEQLCNNSFPSSTPVVDTTEATLSTLLGAFENSQSTSMDRGATEYSQSGLHSPYSNAFNDAQSEEISADHTSAAHYSQQQQDARLNQYSSSATPTSEYSFQQPPSARSATFPEQIPRHIHQASNRSGNSGGMAQSTSPSMPLQDGRPTHHNTQIKSDQDVPIDPSIAASSPTYPPHGQYSAYPAQQEMQHGFASHPTGPMYQQPRPDWGGYAGSPQQHPMQNSYNIPGAHTPTSAAPVGGRTGQVYSFVPIPGAQQHKRPRRRFEEIERMYKCGWNGCEKAYGTLNHLNAHVTMQSHGTKRTPEEFKEIRKEWKARKKEEENQRKAEDDRSRAAVPSDAPNDNAHPPSYQQPARAVQLPPIGYQPGAQVPGQYQAPAGGVSQLQEYGNNHLQYSGYPASPYGAQNQMYSQHNAGPAKYEH